jgi:hypothetical protein
MDTKLVGGSEWCEKLGKVGGVDIYKVDTLKPKLVTFRCVGLDVPLSLSFLNVYEGESQKGVGSRVLLPSGKFLFILLFFNVSAN